MKTFLFAIGLILTISTNAQEKIKPTNVFIRVYNLQGEKIGKGKVLSISEDTLCLFRASKTIKIPIDEIETIWTKKSFGNSVLTGTLVGATVFGIAGASSTDSESWILPSEPVDRFLIGATFGGILGTPIGGIAGIFKKRKEFQINGSVEKMKIFKEFVMRLKK